MKHKYSFLVLFIVVVVFSILGSLTYEPFSNLLDISRTDLSGDSTLAVPSCSATGSGSSGSSGNINISSEDYILKTQIVPPVCPSCPPYIGHSHDSNLAELDASTNLTSTEPTPAVEKQKQQEKSNAEAKFSFKQTSETKVASRDPPNPLSGLFGSGGSGSSGGTRDGAGGMFGTGSNALGGFNRESGADISEYKAEIEKLKEQLRELKTYDGKPPPCPACERCPEPSFDCKKVPNYRSTALGEYLPMPILNDFSSFT